MKFSLHSMLIAVAFLLGIAYLTGWACCGTALRLLGERDLGSVGR